MKREVQCTLSVTLDWKCLCIHRQIREVLELAASIFVPQHKLLPNVKAPLHSYHATAKRQA